MKRIAVFVSLVLLMGVAFAQSELTNRHGVGYGRSYRDVSGVYVARTPYTLEWTSAEKYSPNSKDPSWKAKDTESCVHVYDADTGKLIFQSKWGPLRGSIKIPQGGRHKVRVFSLGEWRANIIEDAEMLKKAHREGYLTKTSVLTEEARAGSVVGRRESVGAAMAEDVKAYEEEKVKVGAADPQRQTKLNTLDEKIRVVRLAASRSSDVKDYEARKRVLLAPL